MFTSGPREALVLTANAQAFLSGFRNIDIKKVFKKMTQQPHTSKFTSVYALTVVNKPFYLGN